MAGNAKFVRELKLNPFDELCRHNFEVSTELQIFFLS